MVNPTPGYGITTAYRKRGPYWSLGFHTGADLAGGRAGAKIVSATPGRVIAANAYDKSYGYKVIIRWGNFDVWYCHMPRNVATVKVGQQVAAGQQIGIIGATGNVTGPHLHMELRVAGGGFAAANFRDPQTAINYQASSKPTWGKPDTWTIGATGPDVTRLGQRLVVWAKFASLPSPYKAGPGPTFTEVDRAAVAAFQKRLGWTGESADGFPGVETFKRLAVNPAPSAPAPKSCTIRSMSMNVNAQRLGTVNTYGHASFRKGKTYAPTRVKIIEQIRDQARASFVHTQEQGTKAQAAQLAAEFPDSFRHIVGGDARGDLTNAIHYAGSARKLIRWGVVPLGTGRFATWGVYEDLESGLEFVKVSAHPDYRRLEDKLRQQQIATGIAGVTREVGDLPQIWGLDANDDADDTFDGPGRAFTAAGFRDTEDVAVVKNNLQYGTLHGLDGRLGPGRRYTRFFIRDSKDVAIVCNSIDTLPGRLASDHDAVVVSDTLTEK